MCSNLNSAVDISSCFCFFLLLLAPILLSQIIIILNITIIRQQVPKYFFPSNLNRMIFKCHTRLFICNYIVPVIGEPLMYCILMHICYHIPVLSHTRVCVSWCLCLLFGPLSVNLRLKRCTTLDWRRCDLMAQTAKLKKNVSNEGGREATD